MQIFNNVQMNGWTCSPNTIQIISRCWRSLSFGRYEAFQKLSNLWPDRAPPNTAQFLSRCWKNFFVLMLCSHLKTFELMSGPRSPTSYVTAQLIPRRWKTVSTWCYSHLWPGRAPQTRSSSSHGVEKVFRQVGMKFFNNIQVNGCAVIPQARPNFVHGVEEIFCLDVMQLFENLQVYGCAALPNIPCHGPAHFAALKNRFVLMLCKLSRTFKWTAGRALPNAIQLISRFWRSLSPGWYEAFEKHLNWKLGRVPQTRPIFFHSVIEVFRLDVMQPSKNIQVYSWATLPNIACHDPAHCAAFKKRLVLMLSRLSTKFKWTAGRAPPNTVQLISRCWKNSRLDGMKLSKNNRTDGRAVLPQTRPSFTHGVEKLFVLVLCS